MNYGNELQSKSSSLKQGEGEEMADRLGDNPSRFSKDGSPQIHEQIAVKFIDKKSCRN